MKNLILRMDDVGASSKKYEVYSKIFFGNFLFLKYFKPFKAMGPYNELSDKHWDEILNILKNFNAKLTIGLTAGWVDKKNDIIPFNEKFPKQAKKILEGVKNNLLEVANHGLTHCIVGKHLPRLFSSNRRYHREFWDFLEQEVHESHIFKSQKILEDWLGEKIVSFIPPGNVYSPKTVKSIMKTNITIINSSQKVATDFGHLKYIDEKHIFSFHDKDLALHGCSWLKNTILNIIGKNEQINFLKLKDL
jgi:peptidoglycan/xylan/chitin deacetylase (PgdA/CDA1 family)